MKYTMKLTKIYKINKNPLIINLYYLIYFNVPVGVSILFTAYSSLLMLQYIPT
jgi:hypothetical protein